LRTFLISFVGFYSRIAILEFAYTGLWGGVISSAPSPDPGSPLVLFSFFPVGIEKIIE
jgi:hypothetical protein